MKQREISLKKDESLLVTWMPEPFRYARLVSVIGEPAPNHPDYIFDIHPIEVGHDGVPDYSKVKVRFTGLYCVVTLGEGGDQGYSQVVYKHSWGERTLKQLLVWLLATYNGPSGGYEIVDWGGFAVPDEQPA